jgi:hypothetical protein
MIFSSGAYRCVISIAVTLGFGFILGFRITATPLSAAMGRRRT